MKGKHVLMAIPQRTENMKKLLESKVNKKCDFKMHQKDARIRDN